VAAAVPVAALTSPEQRRGSGVAVVSAAGTRKARTVPGIEGPMATRQQHRIVETPTQARQAEPGPSVLALLTISTGLAVLILGVIWFVFFHS
jgi:hypothetical protein